MREIGSINFRQVEYKEKSAWQLNTPLTASLNQRLLFMLPIQQKIRIW